MSIPKMISEECCVVAFYGIDPSPDSATSSYHTAVNWFNELGYPPDKISVLGPGYEGSPTSFADVNERLQKTGFAGVTYWSIVSMTPDGSIPVSDYLLTADWSAEYSYALIAARSSLATLSHISMLPVVRRIVQDVRPTYGIGFKREHRLGPTMYAIGICEGLGIGLTGEAYEDARNISQWSDFGLVEQVYRTGLLRDVYPWNLLTRAQLARQVDGASLEEWVRQNASRGVLGTLCDAVSLWEVGEADIPAVRQALRLAGVIFDWRRCPQARGGE